MKIIRLLLVIFLISFSMYQVAGQTIATFNATLDKISNIIDVPASINLDEVTFEADSTLALFELQGKKRISIPFQIKNEGHRVMYWSINTSGKTNL